MLTVALCDDDAQQMELMAGLLQEYMGQRPGLSLRLFRFLSGQELLLSENCAGFDLYLLDVLMPEPNGIETALRLREQGAEGMVIYLTSSRDYAVESYQARAFFYLVKPVERKQLFWVLDQALDELNRRRDESVVITTRRGTRRVALDSILYAERVGRVMRYYCADGTLDSTTLRGSFREMAASLLSDRRFCLCGASFVLNLRHVDAVEDSVAVMDDGSRLPIPRRLCTQIRRAWMDYWLEESAL